MFLIALLLCSIAAVLADDACYFYPYGYINGKYYKYCTWGCCDENRLEDPCCDGLSSGAIAGIVLGAIFLVSLLVILIVVCQRRARYTTIEYSTTTNAASGPYSQPPPSYAVATDKTSYSTV